MRDKRGDPKRTGTELQGVLGPPKFDLTFPDFLRFLLEKIFANRFSPRLCTFFVAFEQVYSVMNALTRRGRGLLVAFEGCDRSGKSTQCQMLVDYLKSTGRDVAHLCFPDRTTSIGKSINSYLQGTTELEDHSIHLLFSANRWEAVPKINELIEKGTLVIMDRYAFSGVAFTAAKKGFDVKWCKNPDRGLPGPDVVFYLDISIKDAEMRGQFGEERYEKAEFQQRVADIYKQLRSDDWKVLDAMRDKNDIHMEIRSTILEMEELCRDAPLKDLWTNNS